MMRSERSGRARGRLAALGLLLAAGALAVGTRADAQRASTPLPFEAGESCVYRGSSRLGRIGTGTMSVEPSDEVGGRRTLLLRSDFRGRVGPAGVEDRTRSWFDPELRGALRFTKRERSPLGSRDEDVRMDVAARRWRDVSGAGGAMTTGAPLDELSFIYFIRTLRLAPGETHSLARHYDPARNPVQVRVVGRGPIEVPAGRFQAIEVEMRVKDPVRYRGEGVIQIHLTDDARHIPVRIESSIPRVGRMVLSLQSGTGTCAVSQATASR